MILALLVGGPEQSIDSVRHGCRSLWVVWIKRGVIKMGNIKIIMRRAFGQKGCVGAKITKIES